MAMKRKQYFKIVVYHCTSSGIEPEPVDRLYPTRHSPIYNPTTDCSLNVFYDNHGTKTLYYSVLMKDRNDKLFNGYYCDEWPIGQSREYA